MRSLIDYQDLRILEDEKKCVKDDVSSSNIQFGIIFMNRESIKLGSWKRVLCGPQNSNVIREHLKGQKGLRCDKDVLSKMRSGKLHLTSSELLDLNWER